MIEIRTDDKGLLLFAKDDAIVSLKDMLYGLDYLEMNDSLPRNLRLLEDSTNVTVTFVVNDLDKILKRIHEVSEKYESIRHAVLHDSPVNTAYAFMMEKYIRDNRYKLKVFSTMSAAMAWLNT
jgi:hypothetical protein